ncbi:MAG: hypothetical protein SOU84_02815 [Candidatus Faecimonas sp.]|nr:hypothetical protein [Mycoplasmatota bacterium]MDY2908071.1 hypothetical protein [Candidatus Faecimonas sp.]
MGELNSCFDHKRIKETKDNIEGIYDNAVFSCFNQNLENLIASLPYYDENHDVISKNIETLETYTSKIEKCSSDFENLYTAIESSIKAYDDAESATLLFLTDLAKIISDDLGNKQVAGYINDGTVNKNTLADDTSEFMENVTEAVKKQISSYAMYLDETCPEGYSSAEKWKEALEAKYEALGYSSYDASDLAYAEMAKWRTAQTGAKVTTNAISEFAEETYTDMEETVKTEYNELVDKYKDLGATEKQAKELATAESEYIDASDLAKESPDNWAYSDSSKKYSEWQKLKEEYGITEESSNNSGTASEQNTDPGTKEPTTDSGNGGGGGNSSGNDIQPRKTSTGTGNSSSGTNSSSQNNNSSSPSENNSSSQSQNTPSNGTEEKPSNGNENSVISEGEEQVPETPNEEKPSTTPEPNNPPADNNNNNNNNTNNGGSINNNPSNGGNNSYYPPSNNGNSGGSSSGGNYTGGGSSNAPSTGTGTPNDNVSTTTPSAPESDANITDNTGETLDVISIDKNSGTSSASTSSNDGGSVIPTILGVGVAGAAAVAGAKIIHDKKQKENEYSYEEDTENNSSFSELDPYTEDASVTMTPGSYKAGSANNLVLEGTPEDIKIDESIANIPNKNEELE